MALVKSNKGMLADSEQADDLSCQETKANISEITNNLSSPDPEIRRLAARDLYQQPDAASDLLRSLENEQNFYVQEAILDSLLSISDENVVEGLIPFLNSDSANLRNSVIEVLQSCPEDVGDHIDRLLQAEDPDIRIFAMDIIGLLPHPKVPDWITQQLKNETHVNVLGAAIDKAAQIGEPEFTEALTQIRERWHDVPYIKFATNVALSRIYEENGDNS